MPMLRKMLIGKWEWKKDDGVATSARIVTRFEQSEAFLFDFRNDSSAVRFSSRRCSANTSGLRIARNSHCIPLPSLTDEWQQNQSVHGTRNHQSHI